MAGLSACDSHETKRVEPCAPSCGDRCEGADGCGGECECKDTLSECAGACAETEQCVGGQCVCEPQCTGKACGADGCGGTCPCPDGHVQNAEGDWVPLAECTDQCPTSGWACGLLCGRDCGACSSGAQCALGQCACAPKCDGSSCNDGCGGSCECGAGTLCNPAGACVPAAACKDTCASESASCGAVCGKECGRCDGLLSCVDARCVEGVSCDTCSVRMRLLDKRVSKGRLLEATIAIEYAPGSETARPRLADLRIVADRNAQLMEVTAGDALETSQKELYKDPKTGASFRAHGDGSYQIMAFSIGNTEPIQAGRIATLRFALGTNETVSFGLARRHEMLAPPLADTVLQNSPYDRKLMVTP